jgi:hypothetical protein
MRHYRSSQTLAIAWFHAGQKILYPSFTPTFPLPERRYDFAIGFHPTGVFMQINVLNTNKNSMVQLAKMV